MTYQRKFATLITLFGQILDTNPNSTAPLLQLSATLLF